MICLNSWYDILWRTDLGKIKLDDLDFAAAVAAAAADDDDGICIAGKLKNKYHEQLRSLCGCSGIWVSEHAPYRSRIM